MPNPIRTRPRRKRLSIGARVMLLGLLVLAAWTGYVAWDKASRAPGDKAPLLEFTVEGLDCPFWCAVRLTNAIDDLDGASVETWDQSEGTVIVRHDPARQSAATLQRLIEEAGFPVLETRVTH